MSTLEENSPGKARQDHRETSHDAANQVLTGPLRVKVLRAIIAHDGLTDEEIVQVTDIAPSSARPRRVELVERGFVETTVTKPGKSRRQMAVWQVTELGTKALNDYDVKVS